MGQKRKCAALSFNENGHWADPDNTATVLVDASISTLGQIKALSPTPDWSSLWKAAQTDIESRLDSLFKSNKTALKEATYRESWRRPWRKLG